MSLLFSTQSRFVIAFLPRSRCLLISWLQPPSTVILEPEKIKSVTASIFSPSICHEVILGFWMLSFKLAFSLSSFTFIKRLFSYSLPSAIRVVSSAYLKLLMFLPEILIPACDSSNVKFHIIYSSYKLKIRVRLYGLVVLLSQSGTSLFFHILLQMLLFDLHRIPQETAKVLWYSHLFTNFSHLAVIHTVKGFSIINEAEVEVFLEFPCFLYDTRNVCNLISGFSAFLEPSLYI